MYTKLQQEILDNITAEFDRLNNPLKPSGGYINVSKIQEDIAIKKKALQEIAIERAENLRLRESLAIKWLAIIEKELEPLEDISCDLADNGTIIKLTTDVAKDCLRIWFEVKDYINTPYGESRKVGVRFTFNSTSYETMEQLLKSENFSLNLQKAIEKNKKLN